MRVPASSPRGLTMARHLVVAVLVSVAAPAGAQRLDLTAFGGWRFGGAFDELSTGAARSLEDGISYGLIAGIPWNAEYRSRLEVIWSHQSTTVGLADSEVDEIDVTTDFLQIGGSAPFRTPNEKVETLLTGGLGATLLQTNLEGAGSEIRFSASLGVGLLYHLSARVGLRLEGRGWWTLTGSGGAVFCSGGCVVAFSGSGFWQGEVLAGLRVAL